ncbi:MAG TPA: hypothetical protein ENL34_01355 [Chloroflexi bacterium]|nr:hypothetical protein [Chloroflexota bacterium]
MAVAVDVLHLQGLGAIAGLRIAVPAKLIAGLPQGQGDPFAIIPGDGPHDSVAKGQLLLDDQPDPGAGGESAAVAQRFCPLIPSS